MINKIAQTKHDYSCYTTTDAHIFESWEDFYDEWNDAHDYFNLLFRFDINQMIDENDDDIPNEYQMELFYVLQRKGILLSVTVEHITKADLPKINKYLSSKWKYLSNMWKEFSNA